MYGLLLKLETHRKLEEFWYLIPISHSFECFFAILIWTNNSDEERALLIICQGAWEGVSTIQHTVCGGPLSFGVDNRATCKTHTMLFLCYPPLFWAVHFDDSRNKDYFKSLISIVTFFLPAFFARILYIYGYWSHTLHISLNRWQ